MGTIEDVRKVFQDIVAPDLKAIVARIDGLEKIAAANHASLLSRIADMSADLDELSTDLERFEGRLEKRIDGVDKNLSSRIDGVDKNHSARIDGVEKSLSSRIDRVEINLGSRIDKVDVSIGRIEASMVTMMHTLSQLANVQDMRERLATLESQSRSWPGYGRLESTKSGQTIELVAVGQESPETKKEATPSKP